ncbi:hypothetical protein [Pontibacillus marinus]|uniref:DUF4367 domain-containing protein n=1 Tax=Pontibacillus marinus BH030004 = DSM 16465 TaxID=1385511 RepID=A0A0A5G7J1_9BACI|nr:hypothetical protein [Pontibacillus marinus]KGX87148.1 hypothetical protein N783_10500 [Pontibacillus marinus BH030004 = DSM 16465]
MNKNIVFSLLIVFVLSACTQSSSYLGEQEIKNSDKLKEFNRTIKFPTYSPFEVGKTSVDIKYRGPQEIKDDKVIKSKEGEPKFQTIITRYTSKDSPTTILEIEQSSSSVSPLEVNSRYSKDNLIDIGDGLKGLYYFNGRAQILSWEDEGSTYNMYVMTKSKEKQEREPVDKKEIFKIAKSFKTY